MRRAPTDSGNPLRRIRLYPLVRGTDFRHLTAHPHLSKLGIVTLAAQDASRPSFALQGQGY
jgi:hypothetical protein